MSDLWPEVKQVPTDRTDDRAVNEFMIDKGFKWGGEVYSLNFWAKGKPGTTKYIKLTQTQAAVLYEAWQIKRKTHSTLALTVIGIVIVIGLLFVSVIASLLALVFFFGMSIGIAYDRDFGPHR